MRRSNFFLLLIVILLASTTAEGQKRGKSKNKELVVTEIAPRKLVVGIVVDQMRYDYLTRFWDHYGDGGFKRLVEQGFSCKNHHFNYMPTKTAPGHASIYTGTTPAMHGILANWWYDRNLDETIYCVSDSEQKSLGTDSKAGKMSPKRMLVSTVTDELRVSTQMKAKTIGVAIKDRGAVLPIGYTGNSAYWFEGDSLGNWISSSYYMEELPEWVSSFNASDSAEKYKRIWSTLKSIDEYGESGKDDRKYERIFKGEVSSTFPHDLPKIWDLNDQFSMLRETPFGNSLTTDFALAAIEGENLGVDTTTDFLTVSYSSTDYVGHAYGVYSKEVQDTYLRLDKDLERLLDFLDNRIGAGSYTVFLTADHGAPPAPGHLMELGLPGGFVHELSIFEDLKKYVSYRYGTSDIVKNVSNFQVFLDEAVINNLDISTKDIQMDIAEKLLENDEIEQVFTKYHMFNDQSGTQLAALVQKGFNQKRSGDVLFVLKAGYIPKRKWGTDHGSSYAYDTHVPLLFYGNGVKKGETLHRTEVSDIAPTLSAMLGIAFPSGTTGTPIVDLLKE